MEELQAVLGYHFTDPKLLIRALTHGSVGYEAQRRHEDNQRLEFLGDAVLQLVLTEMLYTRLDSADEGTLTKIRSQLVSTKAFSQVAQRINLGHHLIMGRGEVANGGRQRDNTLADAIEAIAGAIHLDGGIEATRAFAQRHFAGDLELLSHNPMEENPKGQLQEMLQAISTRSPSYQVTQESGPDHAKHFETRVTWHDVILGRGEGRSKKEAEVSAATEALKNMPALGELQAIAKGNYRATEKTIIGCEQAGKKVGQG